MAGIAIVSSGRAGCEGNAAAGTVSMLANGRDHGTVALLPHLGKDRIILVQARLLLWHMQVKSPARGRTFSPLMAFLSPLMAFLSPLMAVVSAARRSSGRGIDVRRSMSGMRHRGRCVWRRHLRMRVHR